MKNANTSLKPRSFRCDEITWTKFKVLCTIEGNCIQDAVANLIEDYVNTNEHKIHGTTRPRSETNISSVST